MNRAIIIIFGITALIGCRPGVNRNAPTTRAATSESTSTTAKCPVRITATIGKKIFKEGEPITIHLEMSFDGSVIYLEEDDFFHRFHPKVSSPSGLPMDLSQSGSFYQDDHTGGSMQIARVGPHYTNVYDFIVSDLFDFSTPGDYRISFVRSACDAPQSSDMDDPRLPEPQFVGLVSSNEVVLRVTP